MPTHGITDPAITLGCAGGLVTVTASVLEADAPQFVFAVTVTLPLVADVVVVNEAVVEVPDHPPGRVHVYDVAPLTGVMLYVWLVPLHTAALPLMGPGTAGTPVEATARLCGALEPQAFVAITVIVPLPVPTVADKLFVVDVPPQPAGSVHVYDVADGTAVTP